MIIIGLNKALHTIEAMHDDGTFSVVADREAFKALVDTTTDGIYFSSSVDFPEEYGFTAEEVDTIIIR